MEGGEKAEERWKTYDESSKGGQGFGGGREDKTGTSPTLHYRGLKCSSVCREVPCQSVMCVPFSNHIQLEI